MGGFILKKRLSVANKSIFKHLRMECLVKIVYNSSSSDMSRSCNVDRDIGDIVLKSFVYSKYA